MLSPCNYLKLKITCMYPFIGKTTVLIFSSHHTSSLCTVTTLAFCLPPLIFFINSTLFVLVITVLRMKAKSLGTTKKLMINILINNSDILKCAVFCTILSLILIVFITAVTNNTRPIAFKRLPIKLRFGGRQS